MKNGFKIWAKAAGIRAAKTVAQTAISVIGVSAVLSDVNWVAVLPQVCFRVFFRCLQVLRDCPKYPIINKYIFKASEYYVI